MTKTFIQVFNDTKNIEKSYGLETAYKYIMACMAYDIEGEKTTFNDAVIQAMYTNNTKTLKQNTTNRNRARSAKAAEPFDVPTLEDIQNVIEEKHYNVNAKAFESYYSERNWHYKTGEPVRDWRKCLARWNVNSYNYNGYNNMIKNDHVMNDSEIDAFFKMAENR